jgi:hypothetical protein
MANLIKAMLVFALLLIVITIAQAAYTNTLYMPMVLSQPTTTPTTTATPTATITPTPTNTLVPGVHIIYIEHSPPYEIEEYVSIKNTEGQTQDMTDWTLRDENKNIFNFPDNYRLLSGKSVKVWTKSGKDTSTDLYWGLDEPVWNLGSDCGYLRNEDNVRVSSYCYSKPTKTPTVTPETK